MKLKTSAYLLFISVCTACTWAHNPGVKEAVAKDTLSYEPKHFKQRAADCGNKPDSACTVVNINYPVFKDEPVLNDSVRQRLIAFFPENKGSRSLDTLTQRFIAAYEADRKDNNRAGMFYTMDTRAEVVRQDSSLTTLQINGYTFSGGAHGSSYTTFINWDTKKHRDLKLDDILVSGYLPKLNAVAGKIFRKQENLSDTASLARDYFFKGDKFRLNDNFLITPVGLRFLYNQYEIKPYAAGTTDLVIPYNKIKSLIKPGTILKQYIK